MTAGLLYVKSYPVTLVAHDALDTRSETVISIVAWSNDVIVTVGTLGARTCIATLATHEAIGDWVPIERAVIYNVLVANGALAVLGVHGIGVCCWLGHLGLQSREVQVEEPCTFGPRCLFGVVIIPCGHELLLSWETKNSWNSLFHLELEVECHFCWIRCGL